MENADFDKLASTLFDGEEKVADIKFMPGLKPDMERDHLATTLWNSMKRVGLIVDGKIVNRNR
jgi:hypothetical protein